MILATQILLTVLLVLVVLFFTLKPMEDDAPFKVVAGYVFAMLFIIAVPYTFVMGLIWIWRW